MLLRGADIGTDGEETEGVGRIEEVSRGRSDAHSTASTYLGSVEIGSGRMRKGEGVDG